MEETSHQEMPQQPTLCAKGCGFFGNTATEGMCSKCYRDHAKLQEPQKASEPPKPVERPAVEVASPAVASPSAAAAEAAAAVPEEQPPVQANPGRCFCCSKKVGLTGFKCRCNYIFCSTHRYADQHSCTFDYKTHGQSALAKANPVLVAEKIQKI